MSGTVDTKGIPSSYNKDYAPRQITKTVLSEEKRDDLRKSHFMLGKHAPIYSSTNDRQYSDKSGKSDFQASKATQEQMNQRMRSHHLTFGSHLPHYSSVSNAAFSNYTAQSTLQAK